MLTFVTHRPATLTPPGIGSRLSSMTRPTFFGFSTQQMAKIAQEAMEDAVAANAKASIPITGLVDGRVQTLAPTDPRILAVVSKSDLRLAKVSDVERV